MLKLKEYLSSTTIEVLENKSMDCPFKTYNPLDRGNEKLDKSILSFSLIPQNTCPEKCYKCYDLKAFRHIEVCNKRKYNLHMVINEPDRLGYLITEQIKNSRTVKAVRIHVGGDFELEQYTAQYLAMWRSVVHYINVELELKIKFYTYTKTNKTEQLKAMGINVVKSIREDFHFNYDKLDNLLDYQSKYKDWFICPAYKANPDYENVICGKTCTACQTMEKVMFVMH